MSTGRFTERQRELLAQLADLAAERVRNDAMIEQRYRTALTAAETQRDDAVESAKNTRILDFDAEHKRYGQSRTAVRDEAAGLRERTELAYENDREDIEDKATQNEQEARKKMDEAVWLAETVYEAHQDKPEARFHQVESVVDEMRTVVHTVLRAARDRVGQFRQNAVLTEAPAEPRPLPTDEKELETTLRQLVDAVRTGGQRLHRLRFPRLFRGFMFHAIAFLVVAITAGVTIGVRGGAVDQWLGINAGIAAVAIAAFGFLSFTFARRSVRRAWQQLDRDGQDALRLIDHCLEVAADRQSREERQLLDTRERDTRTARETYQPIIAQIAERRQHRIERIEEKYPARLTELESLLEQDLQRVDAEHEGRMKAIEDAAEHATVTAERAYARAVEEIEAEHDEQRAQLSRTWHDGMRACTESFRAIDGEQHDLFVPWDDDRWSDWSPPARFSPSVRFATLGIDRRAIPGSIPDTDDLRTELPAQFRLPATLDFPDDCSLLLETDGDGRTPAIEMLQAIMLRLLTGLPPGKVRFTILDPVSLGQNFAAFMHLADYDESFVTSRIWTEPRHIEQRLTDITEHMENVIQKYLRNEFETIAQYNEQAGEIAEPYRFLVISDLPVNFSETAAKRLASIVASGPRCGVFTLLHLDRRHALPPGLRVEDLEARSTTLTYDDGAFTWKDDAFRTLPVEPEQCPPDDFVTPVLHQVGEASRDATRVEVPFDVISPDDDAMWSRSSAKELRVPLGRAGATKLQDLVIGPGTSQHALIAGKTGSGKSTLLHVLITNLALWYGPDEVQFYLVDFKKGVEFKTYGVHELPHARAVAVESDREFGLSVLQRIDDELKTRGDAFRAAGAQDLGAYRERTGAPMPRILLIVDEFQELFVEDDKIGQDSALLLDRIVRQGRAFGIHVLLGSQTLGGAYSLARSTMGQMQVRVALQCSEADSYLIMSDDNSAARLLARPGEAIYNDAGGRIEGNSPFQICWLPERVREAKLAAVRERSVRDGWERPEPIIVFEGTTPADPAANHPVTTALAAPPETPVRRVDCWLGEAIAIKGPTHASFRAQSGSNLLVVGQRDEAALAMFQMSLLAIAAQSPASPIMVLDGSPVDSPWAGRLAATLERLPNPTRSVVWRDVETAINDLAEDVALRSADHDPDRPPAFLLIFGLQRFRMLRAVDDFSFSADPDAPPKPDKQFADILRDGPPHGVHTLAWCDTATNLNRTLERQGLREFEMRVLFQMSSADSTTLIDVPSATKLGMQRALYYNEELGLLEKFRPWSLPHDQWVDAITAAPSAGR